MNAIQNRYEFVLYFDVENGNPNGDPDAGNMPRIDPETNLGLVTDVCLKRKIRNYVALAKGGASPHEIYVQEKAILSLVQGRAHEAVAANGGDNEEKKNALAQEWMCKNFFDVRAFGAVMSLKTNNCGQVRGPVQLAFARSVEPVTPLDISITRMAVATEKEAKAQSGDNRTMGRKQIVPYGLYRAEGFVSAPLAGKTGFSDADLALLWESLINMFDHDRSAARGKMAARKLVVFKHATALGNAPAQKLFSLVRCDRREPGAPARAYEDYTIALDRAGVPAGVEALELL